MWVPCIFSLFPILRVCLFKCEIWWMKKFREKMRKKNFFKVCLVEWEGKKINSETQMFSLEAHQKVFFPKLRENWKEKIELLNGQKCSYALTHDFVCSLLFFTIYLFISWTFLFLPPMLLLFFLLFITFLVLIGHHF